MRHKTDQQFQERRSTGAVLLAIVLTAALTGGIIYRWHFIIVRNVQNEARTKVQNLHNEVKRLNFRLEQADVRAGSTGGAVREHIIFQTETDDAHKLSYNEYYVTYPKRWYFERDTQYNGSGFRALFKDAEGRRLASMQCPFEENFPFDAWSFQKTARTVDKEGTPYRIELWEGTPRAATAKPRLFIFAGPVGADRLRMLDSTTKAVQGCQFSSIDTTFDERSAQGVNLLFQSLEIH